MRIFMFNGVVIGALGSTLGVAIGVLLCYLQYHYRFIPLPGDILFHRYGPCAHPVDGCGNDLHCGKYSLFCRDAVPGMERREDFTRGKHPYRMRTL